MSSIGEDMRFIELNIPLENNEVTVPLEDKMHEIKFNFKKFKWCISGVPQIYFDSKKQAKIYLKNL